LEAWICGRENLVFSTPGGSGVFAGLGVWLATFIQYFVWSRRNLGRRIAFEAADRHEDAEQSRSSGR
jgi:hypothetical protein